MKSALESPELLDFFDIAALTEAIVLHDRTRLLFPEDCEHEVEKQFLSAALEALRPLEKAGLIEVAYYDEARPSPSAPPVPLGPEQLPGGATRLEATEDFMAWFLLANVRFVIAERSSEGDAVVLPRQAAIYKMNRRVRTEHSICDLYLNYGSIRELAELARRRSGATLQQPYPRPPLPPICLETLKISRSLEGIWQAVGELWVKHAAVRRLHAELRAIQSDEGSSPRARERETRRVKEAWSLLGKKWRARVESFGAADTTTDMSRSSGLMADLAGLSVGSGGDLAVDPTAPVKWAEVVWQLFGRVRGWWRLRQIHDSLEAYWRVSDRELYGHVERLLGRRLSREDHENIVRAEESDRAYPQQVVLSDLFPD